MQVYTVTKEFCMHPLNELILVGQTIGKLDGSVLTVVDGSQYDNDAFYDWVGSTNSLDYLSYAGVVPDPPVGGGVPATPVSAPSGPSDTGTQGTWAFDGNYIYWCVATDTWVRWVVVTSW